MKKRLLLFTALATFIAFYYFVLYEYLSIAMLKYYRYQLLSFVEHHYWLSVALFISLYSLSTTCMLPTAALLSIAAGFLFGVFLGAFYALVGATFGATGSFLLVRYAVGHWFQQRYASYLKQINTELEEWGVYYLIAIRFFAGIPFFAVNMSAALTTISVETFFLTTVLGILPGCLVFAYAGSNLAQIESTGDILSPPIIRAFALLAALALLPLVFKRFIPRLEKHQ